MKIASFGRAVAFGLLAWCATSSMAQIPLADKPVFSIASVPGNLALALSVEFPTAVSVAHLDTTYDQAKEYLGYFDPNKCYLYKYYATENFSTGEIRHFYPNSVVGSSHKCTTGWSGNFLNWTVTPTIDPFRWALTGGYRVYDSAGTSTVPGVTILEKAWSANGQTGTVRFPNRSLGSSTAVADATGVGGSSLSLRVHDLGNKMYITRTGNVETPASTADYDPGVGLAVTDRVYILTVRVKVCDSAVGLESNCVAYTNATYKPEGLMQKYSDRIRYSTFGYLNDDSITRDGGVLRARQSYIGPMQPVPLSTSITNPYPEWSGVTGVMETNPRPTDASDTNTNFSLPLADSIVNSGVMNYLNKFGQITPGSYKTYDPVGELYYAAVRYYKNLNNVPEWSNMASATAAQKKTYIDGFPVITTWDDPIIYSCQKNFILGIGDVNTHADKNVPHSSIAGGYNEPVKPSTLDDDPVQSTTMSNKVGTIQGNDASLGTTNPYGGCCNNNSALMAGIAYDSNTRDIRPDNPLKPQTKGIQTIQTYWLDVLEYSIYKNNNQFYLATKFGAFDVPVGFDPDSATALPSESSWYTSTRLSPTGQKMPDSYFVAAKADDMVAGLKGAFEKIAEKIEATTTGVATALPQVLSSGNATYSASYSAKDWTSEVIATTRVFGPVTVLTPPPIEHWKFSEKLATQLAGTTGLDGKRRMATWNGSSGIAFTHAALTTAGLASKLDTPWIPGDDSADFVKYLRGDRTKETATPNYRQRTKLVHDIVGSRLTAVGRPAAGFSDTFNPGYSAFKTTWVNRRRMLYVGSNGGVLHAINGAEYTNSTKPSTVPAGAQVDDNAGTEVFAYVPSVLFNGPSSPATPQDNGLAALGNPAYLHRYFVNASPMAFDIDLANTVKGKSVAPGNCKPTSDPTNWRSVLIGGLGKGGKSYYALDITDPTAVTNDSDVAGRVLWEFPRNSDPLDSGLKDKVGFSFGEPVVVKTAQHGWVVVLTSGYNNTDGKGYIFIVDACTGYLVQAPIKATAGSPTDDAGLANATAYVLDFEDGKADAIYAGDIQGNLWRVDITATTGSYPDAEKIAYFQDGSGSPKRQPMTVRPMVEYDPKTLARFVMVGTGRLLDKTDTADLQKQNFYAVRDGDSTAFDATLNSTTKVVRSDLIDITDSLTTGSTVFSNQKGWYVDLGKGDPSLGWRMITKTASFFGTVLFVATLPDSSDECASTGSSLIYAVNFGSGKSILTNAGVAVSSLKKSYTLTDLSFYTDGKGSSKIVIGGDKGEIEFPESKALPSPQLRRLNWREITIAE